MNYQLSKVSGNSKTGPIAVSMSSKNTCPSNCPLKASGCYAKSGVMNIHWQRITNGTHGTHWNGFIENLKTLPDNSKFRHNQSGDLPGSDNEIDTEKLRELSNVIKEKNLEGWTYTHKPLNRKNLRAIRSAIKKNFIINISADNVKAADRSRRLGLPTVVILPSDAPDKSFTPAGNKIIVCPNQTEKHKDLTCKQCGLCAKNRNVIIGFRAHGISKKRVSEIAAQ